MEKHVSGSTPSKRVNAGVLVNGSALHKARQRRDLTQAELADRVGTSKTTISQAENHNTKIRRALVERISGELKVPIKSLLSTPDALSGKILEAAKDPETLDILKSLHQSLSSSANLIQRLIEKIEQS